MRVTTLYKSTLKSVEGSAERLCILTRPVITFSFGFAVFVCTFKSYLWDNTAKSSPRGSWEECTLRGAVTEGCFQIFARFSFFFSVSLHIPNVRAKIKAWKLVAFPTKGNPTGLVSQLNLSQVVISRDVEYEGEIGQPSPTVLEKKREKDIYQGH